ncbi:MULTISPECIES: class I SAM-dependent methyltransferase [Streptomyces]|uniref:class I SAM-dependent methyltransferase n=1 Tax=Streptomyces TaxID=1883 RepID=UPI000D526CFD|nr:MULTISPECIES: class I SAM-dependent methyltransferase [Streptomyces]AWE54040.1 SAM-dependent methyltransferase [Streptomyces nigra]MCF2540303.1 methyltransferase domain-containing protein [Streptomyces sp. FB2]
MRHDDRRPPAAELFDALGADYEKAFAHAPAHLSALEWLTERLPQEGRVLDVGSGTGRPTAATLVAAGHSVLGVDVSPVMVELASRQVPGAEFRHADIRELPLDDRSFDGICVFFSLLQMSRADQAALVRRLASALRPGGHLVLATVPADVEDVEVVFMGRAIRATSFSEEGVLALVRDAGLTVLSAEGSVFTPDHPDGGPEPHLFVRCRRD